MMIIIKCALQYDDDDGGDDVTRPYDGGCCLDFW